MKDNKISIRKNNWSDITTRISSFEAVNRYTYFISNFGCYNEFQHSNRMVPKNLQKLSCVLNSRTALTLSTIILLTLFSSSSPFQLRETWLYSPYIQSLLWPFSKYLFGIFSAIEYIFRWSRSYDGWSGDLIRFFFTTSSKSLSHLYTHFI